MKKLNGTSMDIVAENITKLKELFPEVFYEDKIDFEKLRQVLGNYIEDKEERYKFEWSGKSNAIKIAQTSSMGTLRPCKEESKNWDTTKNLYIEGDNLEVLKLLQKSLKNRVKIQYIDPPYNLSKDFIYNDDFKDNLKNYLRITGQLNEEGKKISTNAEISGRYHTQWLNMMYPRLKLARNLLSDDGVIFISIDDREICNLKKICDEIFGEDNFISTIIWERAYAPVNLKKHFSENHDYILCYAKNIDKLVCNGLNRGEKANSRYKNMDNDIRGAWKASDLSVGPVVEENVYEIITPSGKKVLPPKGYCWRLSEERFKQYVEDNRIWFGEEGNNVPAIKRFLSEVKGTITPMTIWKYTEVGHSQDAKQKLKELFDNKSYFDYPKSVELIKRIIELYSKDECIVMDFFSGSATTAHATMEYNIENNKNLRYILIQLPEEINSKTDTFKDGYKNICEIGKERIRRAGDKIIKEKENKEGIKDLDIGFKVFKLDSSNIREWTTSYNNKSVQYLEENIDMFVANRTEEDIIYEIMLKCGIDLTYPVEELQILDKKIFSIGSGSLIICLNKGITLEVINKLVELKKKLNPKICKVIFKDDSFDTDATKVNAIEILKENSIIDIISI